ncbi:sorbosone dehydrogenase [Rhizobium leguminosarum]|uniref:GMC family oxidoreductase n=1 Tax=Rhizobium leguminosarum TaxID=384 RepID=UPI001A91CE3E|nr:GMC family oxidoreductase N-terminal domain-containing protein [Rhizobium leguminosarum]MBY5556658.1 sorbosone dehydrogenase [Rhizobium leguminosarum]MBY5692459.1 sorbosone dehydrogenase [Rhizobium leguminosarum]MBY5726418.1 sorbosone dehydrogenase [Rhizobium leguminosarum]MBY5746460.1 sorbosone dehydrogenase [Rhizobium leguminosarum]QSW28394.1 GMC family oxidoreductase N-terminal domain-containing protein [Rhizobium leguminosarum]
MPASDRYDYIIVGGGSSACVVAEKLVREGKARVLLLERGHAKANPIMSFPAGYMKFLAKDTYLAMHQTKPQPQLNGRGPIVPQGRVLGGGSAVNAMVYMRGQAADFDLWNELVTPKGSNDGAWSYGDLLPYFKAQEDNDHLAGDFHGVGGPLKISHLGHTSAMTRTYVKTLQAMGIPYNPDFNGAHQFGVGFMQHTIDWKTRRRSSAVDAFLAPVMSDPLLSIETEATVTSIRMDRDRATGVDYIRNGSRKSASAGEIILAAGAYQTPKLLMISGVGPDDELTKHNIQKKVVLSGVGKNLQDHYECPVVATTKGAFGYYGADRGWPMIKAGLQYLMFKTGPVSTTGVETCAFYDPDGNNDRPTIQMFCVPTVYLDRDVMGTEPGDGVTINSLLLRPKARGSVTLASSDPFENPIVDTQIFAHPDDLRLTIAGFRFARTVLEASPMCELIEKEIFPGADVTSDEALAAHCKRTVKTGYHPVGTCKMGQDSDPEAVLDTSLRVRGTRGLRVVDASLMPTIVSGNTNAAVMAAAGKAAGLILV